jgi:hypothetical protein
MSSGAGLQRGISPNAGPAWRGWRYAAGKTTIPLNPAVYDIL